MSIKWIIGAYGGLSVIAAVMQGKYKNVQISSAVLMGIGGLLMIGSMFLSGVVALLVLAFGAIMVHVSAIMNGVKMYGQINKKHHVIRFIISIALIVGLMLEQRL